MSMAETGIDGRIGDRIGAKVKVQSDGNTGEPPSGWRGTLNKSLVAFKCARLDLVFVLDGSRAVRTAPSSTRSRRPASTS